MLGEGLDGKTFGIVGAGRIGRETARLAEAFGARPVFAGRNDPLDELLAVADVVSLHCPLTPETRHLIDESALAAMKPLGGAGQHRTGADRGRARARRRPSPEESSQEPRWTSSSSSRR